MQDCRSNSFTCLTLLTVRLRECRTVECRTVERRCTNVLTARAIDLWSVRVARYSAIAPKTMNLIIHPFLVILFSDFLIHRRTFPINNRTPFYKISIITTLTSPSSLCSSRKYPYPHHGGNWTFQGGGGGQRPRKFRRGGGVRGEIHVQMEGNRSTHFIR